MKNWIILLVGLIAFSTTIWGQEKTIKINGIVTDPDKQPLVGVNITIKDVAGLGVITDIDGRYSIEVKQYQRLLFSYVGFETEEVLIKDQTKVDVMMKESKSSILNEVVVTGTGVQKKINVTGAVSAVDVEVLKSTPSSSISNALAGNVAGVLAMQTSGQPGQNTSEFWIRGISTFGANSSALILVDGFERDMNEISVEDIESFQVLKDASETAIYGSRGANGVVLITTKHGKPGKINVDAKVETSYNTRTNTPDYVDGFTYASLLNEARITRNQEPMYKPEELYILKRGLDPDLYPNVDWQDVLLKDGAMSYKATLNLKGGGANVRYFVSAGYSQEEGMYKTDKVLNDYNTNANVHRWNYRMNADIDITQSTLLSVGISGSLQKQNDAGRGSSVIWNSLVGQNPIDMPVKYSNGYYPASNFSDIRDNPWVAATQTGYRQTWTNRVQTNVTLQQNFDFITKGLKFIGRFGYDTNNNSWINKTKEPERWIAERYRDVDGNLVFKRVNAEKQMEQSSGGSGDRREFFEAELHYNRNWSNHHLGSTLKYNQDSKVQTYNLGEDLKNSVPYRHQGLSGRISYNWAYRYFLNFNFGYTGSENFADGNKFGFFPAFSTAWNIAEEPFIKKNIEWLNMFKLRYSWGKVGNDNVGTRFPYMYTIGNIENGGYQWAEFDFNRFYDGKSYTAVASTGVTWEISTKNDIGLDLSVFDDRFSLTVDYFTDKRTGIFMKRTALPWIVGLNSGDQPRANVGVVFMQGWDGNFAFKQTIGKVFLTIRGNFTYSKNEIRERDEGFQKYPYLYQQGYRVNQTKGLIALGLFEDWDDIRNSPQQTAWGAVEPGDIKYKDVNGDGIINSEDQVAIGSTTKPSLIYGAGISAQWKGLDVNVHFQGAGKTSSMMRGSAVHAFSRGTWGNILEGLTDDRWISKEISGDPATENPNATYPRLEYGKEKSNNTQYSTFWLRNRAYLRLKNVEIGYNIPKTIVNKIHLNKFRLFFRGTNLLTFSKFKLWDPELENGEGYPLTKSISLGLNINL